MDFDKGLVYTAHHEALTQHVRNNGLGAAPFTFNDQDTTFFYSDGELISPEFASIKLTKS